MASSVTNSLMPYLHQSPTAQSAAHSVVRSVSGDRSVGISMTFMVCVCWLTSASCEHPGTPMGALNTFLMDMSLCVSVSYMSQGWACLLGCWHLAAAADVTSEKWKGIRGGMVSGAACLCGRPCRNHGQDIITTEACNFHRSLIYHSPGLWCVSLKWNELIWTTEVFFLPQ